MKPLSYKLILFLLYLAVAGLTFFMYNLRSQRHVSPWDTLSLSDLDQRNLASFGDKARSAQKLRNQLFYNIDVKVMLRESTDRLAPTVVNQLRNASKHCSSDFTDSDSLLTGSNPNRVYKFLNHALAFAGPIATKERLNTEVIRVSFFPKSVETLRNPQDTIPRLIVDFIKIVGDTNDRIKSIKGVSSFLSHSSACEEGIVSLR